MKRKRCGQCEGCSGEDCQVCCFCRDKPKYGGKGVKKQCCIKRTCRCLRMDSTLHTTQVKTTSTVSEDPNQFLARYGRKLHPILRDGNCFFRALSFLVFDTEENHAIIRNALVEFASLNPNVFKKYCTAASFEDHIRTMKYLTIFATQLEIYVAASYFQRPFYVCTQKSGTLQYYWELFSPLPPNTLVKERIYQLGLSPLRCHFEICHVKRCHYDIIKLRDGSIPSIPIPLPRQTGFVNLT